MAAQKRAEEPEEQPSRAAGACVLVVLAGVVVAVLFAISDALAVLVLVTAGTFALWRAARRRVSDSSATPPPEEGRPSCRECAGHELVSVTPSETQKGMLIYTSASADRPHHTHVHVVQGEVTDR
ncbi:hypothetical protein AB0M11_08185 [Streptomyces sp. NPDC051987]|uniref:hypothetical protein n=1 Tax=Streptomyces sp. NPDC051987 TaxID=3155808 RepID=UPI0034361365